MRKVLLWGTGIDFSKHLNIIHYFELKREICVIGVTANEEMYDAIYEYTFFKKDILLQLKFDLIIVMSDFLFREIECEIKQMNIYVPIVPCSVLTIPGFDFDKYIRIKENLPTIFACNCWGGIVYHRLKLPFISPFINLFVKDEAYLQFLGMPRFYMEQTIEWSHTAYDKYLNREYPVGICGDLEIHFNHYKNFAIARADWERRKSRIKWENLFVMMYTEDESVAIRFSQLPYEKKVCFVPFDSGLQGICSILHKQKENIHFFEIVNGIASGRYHDYDLLSILFGDTIKISRVY